MDIKGFKNLLFTKAKNEGFSEYEIYYSEKKSFSVNIYKKQIEKDEEIAEELQDRDQSYRRAEDQNT